MFCISSTSTNRTRDGLRADEPIVFWGRSLLLYQANHSSLNVSRRPVPRDRATILPYTMRAVSDLLNLEGGWPEIEGDESEVNKQSPPAHSPLGSVRQVGLALRRSCARPWHCLRPGVRASDLERANGHRAQRVQVVRPRLHHPATVLESLRPAIRAAHLVTLGVPKLQPNQIRLPPLLIKALFHINSVAGTRGLSNHRTAATTMALRVLDRDFAVDILDIIGGRAMYGSAPTAVALARNL